MKKPDLDQLWNLKQKAHGAIKTGNSELIKTTLAEVAESLGALVLAHKQSTSAR